MKRLRKGQIIAHDILLTKENLPTTPFQGEISKKIIGKEILISGTNFKLPEHRNSYTYQTV